MSSIAVLLMAVCCAALRGGGTRFRPIANADLPAIQRGVIYYYYLYYYYSYYKHNWIIKCIMTSVVKMDGLLVVKNIHGKWKDIVQKQWSKFAANISRHLILWGVDWHTYVPSHTVYIIATALQSQLYSHLCSTPMGSLVLNVSTITNYWQIWRWRGIKFTSITLATLATRTIISSMKL